MESKRRRVTVTQYHRLKTYTESDSSEVGSDEECQVLSETDDTPLDMDNLSMNGEWQIFVQENHIVAEDIEETPCLSTAGNEIFVDEYPGAAEIKSRGLNAYAQIMETDEYREAYRFFSEEANFAEFAWLNNAGLSMKIMDEYCKLPFVSIDPDTSKIQRFC